MAAPDNPNPEKSSGFLPGVSPLPPDQEIGYRPPSEIEHKKFQAQTARTIAFLLLGILAGSFALDYVSVAVLSWYKQPEAVQSLERLFNTWLPVISGLTGGAVAFYFTKEGK